jgi:hypothetical protein
VDVPVAVGECAGGVNLFLGNTNCDQGGVNIADAVCTLVYLFGVEGVECKTPCCEANANVNGDDSVNIADVVSILSYLFAGGTMTAPDGSVIAAGAEGCKLYDQDDVKVPCASPCNP